MKTALRTVAALAALGLALAGPARAAGLLPEDLARVRADEQARIRTIEKVYGAVVAMYGPSVGRGGGSGILVDESGFALTNYHVVRAAGRGGKAGLADGRLYDWRVWGMDPGGDLALVRLSGQPKFPAADLGDSRAVRVGDFCLAMGNPFVLAEDQKPTVTLGIVSGLERFQHGQGGGTLVYGNCIQIDTSINPGNSGGPLFDMDGRVIGINGRGSFEERGRVNVGVGYAVTSDQAMNFFPDLLATRLCMHATLNATFADLDGKVVCDEVNLDSPIGTAGLRPGDELVAFDGQTVRSANQYLNLITVRPPGWPVAVVFRRRAEETAAHVRLTALPYPRAPRQGPPQPRVQPKAPAPAKPPKKEEPPKPGEGPKPPEGGQGGPDRPQPIEPRILMPEHLRAEPGQIMDAALNRQGCRWVLERYAAWLGRPDALKRAAAGRTGQVGEALAMAALAGEPTEAIKAAELEGGDKAAGRRAFRLRLEDKAAGKVLLWFGLPWDEGGRAVRLLKVARDSEAKGADAAWTFDDWREDGGGRVPHAVRRVAGLEERVEETYVPATAGKLEFSGGAGAAAPAGGKG
jgi:S1-C subfamily serine protease